ncbi:MAG: tripartite tricarboxylate transporter substrate-binding protein [Deinococcota bacterium]
MNRYIKIALAVSIIFLSLGTALAQFSASNPECIAPANPGGGWDLTCRAMTQAMTDSGALEDTVRVTNMPGAGGAVAFANVVTQRNDDNSLIVAASPGTTARLAQNQYPGFTEDDVRWLGALGADFGLIAVAADAPYQTLDDLMTALAEDPGAINFGGGSGVGGQDHMKVLLLAQAAGIDPLAIRYTSFDGGGEAMTSLLGGFIDVFPGDAAEAKGQLEAGDIRILAVLSPERLPAPYADVATAKELGYDTEWVIFRGFWGPGDMSDEAYDYWVNVLDTTAASPEWAEAREQAGLSEYALTGEEFEAFAKQQVQDLRELSQALGLIE